MAPFEDAAMVLVGVPLAITESTIEEAMDSIAAAAATIRRRTDAEAVTVAVSKTVVVTTVREVIVWVVVTDEPIVK